MYKNKRILAIIPARGGSKGLVRKNVRPLSGKPLIAWTIGQALKSEYLDKALVSTDDQETAEISKEFRAQVPFIRPAELAKDTSPTSGAVLHALAFLEQQGEIYDYIMLLEPTSPLRKPTDIDNALELLLESENADSLISVGEIQLEHPMIVKKIAPNGYVIPYIEGIKKIHQRQQADKAYFPYGVVYICKVSVYKEKRTFYAGKIIPYFIERWQNFEIDDEVDFAIAETLMDIKNRSLKWGTCRGGLINASTST